MYKEDIDTDHTRMHARMLAILQRRIYACMDARGTTQFTNDENVGACRHTHTHSITLTHACIHTCMYSAALCTHELK